MKSRHGAADWALLIVLAFVWGTAFIAIKAGVNHMPPSFVATGRTLVAALVLGVVLAFSRHALPRGRRNWAYIIVMSFFGVSMPFYLISWGQRSIDSGLAAILVAVVPLVTLALAHFFVEGEHLTKAKAAGFVMGFLGIVVLIGPDAFLKAGGSAQEILAQLAVLAGATCYAIHTIIARRGPPDHALVLSAGVMLVAVVVMVPTTAYLEHPAPEVSLDVGVLAVLWLGIFSTALGTVLIFQLIKRAGPSFASLTNYLVSPIAVLTGIVVLDERPHWSALAALGLIFAGLAVSQIGGRPQVD